MKKTKGTDEEIKAEHLRRLKELIDDKTMKPDTKRRSFEALEEEFKRDWTEAAKRMTPKEREEFRRQWSLKRSPEQRAASNITLRRLLGSGRAREAQQIPIELARRIHTLSNTKRLPEFPTDKMCCLIEAEDSLREAFSHKGHSKPPKGSPKDSAEIKWLANELEWYRTELRRLMGLVRAIGDELGLLEYKLPRLPRRPLVGGAVIKRAPSKQ